MDTDASPVTNVEKTSEAEAEQKEESAEKKETEEAVKVPEAEPEKAKQLEKEGAEDMAIEDRNMDGKYYECIECKSRFDTGAELIAHFSLCPIRTKKGEWDTSCPVLAADRKSMIIIIFIK